MRTVLLILGTFIIFSGLLIIRQEDEKRKLRIEILSKESERLNKEKDRLLHKRDSLMEQLEVAVKQLNEIK